MTKSTKNTELWDQVCKTDPAHTKKFTRTGGFSGTAIKPFWLIHRATEAFGPCGINWGWTEVENVYRAGIWCSKVRLWYLLDGRRGEVEQWGQTQMEGTNRHGSFVDEEAPKKAVTDAVTKCLSYLGFAGDVHLGMFDDSKYVSEVAKEFAGDTPVVNGAGKSATPAAKINPKETARAKKERWVQVKQELLDATTLEQLQSVWAANYTHIQAFGDTADELHRIKDERKAAFQADEAMKAGMPEDFNSIR